MTGEEKYLDRSINSTSSINENSSLLEKIDSNFGISSSGKKRTVTSDILSVIEDMRGSRPPVSSTLAALGVDSLGSVMLVRRLSDHFGGIRIRPTSIFGPGQTIAKFAAELKVHTFQRYINPFPFATRHDALTDFIPRIGTTCF